MNEVVSLHPPVPVVTVQGSLALDLTPRLAPPTPRAPLGPPAFDLVATDQLSRRRIEAFVRRHLQAVVEIAIGHRPASQVLRHCTPRVYADLARRALLVSQAAGTSPARGRGPDAVRPVLLSARTALVREDALEASAHVRHGQRSRAVAARYEIRRGRWQCLVLEWG